MGLIRKWDDENPEGKELYTHESGHWTFSVWLVLAKWSLGPEVERVYGSSWDSDGLYITFGLGPLSFHAARIWNRK